jgi:Bacterial Ig domain/FG-GAP-like repeat/PKD domain/RTX calcium-binding nonapeptide repeat (4 copies)/Beta-propeller repeat
MRSRLSGRDRLSDRQKRFFRPTLEPLERRLLLAAELLESPLDSAKVVFERNQGQMDADVAYAARGADFNLYLTSAGALFGLGESSDPLVTGAEAADPPLVNLTWQGGNDSPSVIGVGQLPGVTNYFAGSDPAEWHTGILSFERVRYDEVYDGIDLEFYDHEGAVEFDWIVASGIDPSQITMVYAGMDQLSIGADGRLVLQFGGNEFVQHAPVTYQLIAGEQQVVESSYRLGEGGEVRFALGAYDPGLPLVIDPVLSYSTYLGGSNNDQANDIATDSKGNTYVIGTTRSANILPGFVTPTIDNNRAFVAKFAPDGTIDTAFSRTLGRPPRFDEFGYRESFGYQVVVGPDDLPLVSFETFETTTLPLEAGGLLPLPGPAHFLHVQKLDASGEPMFDTIAPVPDTPGYFDPIGFVGVHLATDDVGAAYVAYAALRPTQGGGLVPDSFITKLAPDGMVEFTEPAFAGSAAGIAVDSEHNIYVALTTSHSDLPVTAGALQETKKPVVPPGVENLTTDVWVAQFDPMAAGLLAATYLGGTRNDRVTSLAVNPNQPGLVYLVGYTESSNFLLNNPFQQHPPTGPLVGSDPEENGFVTLLDLNKSDEKQLVSSTYFGGSRGDALTDIAIDRFGNVYVAGSTSSTNLPVANPLQSARTIGPFFDDAGRSIFTRDLIVAKFDSTLTALDFSTYFGGSGHDIGASLAVGRNGTIHVAATSSGRTRESRPTGFQFLTTDDFPVLNPEQEFFAGPDTGFNALSTDAVVLAIAQRGTLAGRGISATVGREFTHIVAGFISPRRDASPGDFSVKIDWGDGKTGGLTSFGFVTHPNPASSQFFVHGTHQYESPGVYPVIVHVEDRVTAELSPISNIDVSHSAQSQIEGAIAVDPTIPSRLFAAMTDERGEADGSMADGLLVATSGDGGATWSPRLIGTDTDTVLPGALGYPDVLFDNFGNLFLAYQGSAGNNIVVAWSMDGGRTFKEGDVHEFEKEGAPDGNGDRVVGSPKLAFGAARNELWITFEDLAAGNIRAIGVGVGGLGDVGTFQLQTVTGSTGGDISDIAVGPAGEVAVVWQTVPAGGSSATARLFISKDVDGLGAGMFADPKPVHTSTTDGEFKPVAQHDSVPLGATLAWDTSDGPHAGRLYVVFVDMAEDLSPIFPGPEKLTLFTTFTDDLSVNFWDAPRRVTLDSSFQSMFLPSIALDPVTGNLAVGWYGTRGTLLVQTQADFFVATSRDGTTFSNAQQVNIGSSNALDPDLSPFGLERGYGEAPGMAFRNGRLYPMWSDNSDLRGENLSAPDFEVATAIVGVITVKASPPAIRPIPIEVIKGELFSKPVATFTVQNGSSVTAADFSAQITWGDKIGEAGVSEGMISRPGGPGTPFLITGTHTYTEAGAYPLWVKVHDKVNKTDALPVSNVNAQQGSQAEANIAIDPMNPDRVFAAGVDEPGSARRGIPVATSNDGGVKWIARTIADGNDSLPPSQGDPKVVFDQFGNLFLTYLTTDPERYIAVLRSRDGGQSFTLLAMFTAPEIADQPSIAVGPGEGGMGGSVWLTWELRKNHIMVAGAPVGLGGVGTFSRHLVAPLPDDGFGRNFGDIAVGPAGQVLVTYVRSVPGGSVIGPAKIVVHLDPDGLGSAPFGPPVFETDVKVAFFLPIPAQATRTIDTEGNLAWDRSDGEHRGRVYLVYTDSPAVGSADTNIFLIYSDSLGVSWSEPIQVHNDDALSQFLPSVAVDQSTGNVGVGWHTAVEATNVRTRFVATLSDDGGSTFRLDTLVSPGESDATDASLDAFGNRFQYGDYTGLAFVNGVIQPIWADNSVELDGIPDPRRFDLASARIAVAEVSRALLVVQTFGIAGVEGEEFTKRVATFSDPGGPLAGGYSARINWGDGTPPTQGTITREPDGSFTVFGTHEYKKLGHYPISVAIRGNRTKGEGTATAVIEDAPLFLRIGNGEDDLRVVREQEFTIVVGTLTDLNRHSVAADFIPTITWGDGGGGSVVTLERQPGSGQNGAPNRFTITGKYKYLTEQNYSINVSIRDKPAEKTHDRSGNLISGDPPLIVKPGAFLDIEALEGINTGDLVLVKFERPDDIEVPLDTTVGEYTATINWGDGEVDFDIVPFMTSEDVTVVGRHTYAFAGEFYPYITLVDDSGGFFSVPLIAIVEPDVTGQVRASSSGLVYNPMSDRFVGELNITNTSGADISGPLFVVIHDLPAGVTLESFTAIDGAGNPLYKVNQSKLPAGASLPPIALEFGNPGHVPISYSVQVFDGLRPTPVGGASLVFEPNRGQANEAAAFIARGQGYAIGLSAGQASLVLSGSATQAGAAAVVEFVGANVSPAGVAIDPQPGVSNYFVGEAAITGVPHFGRVRYTEVYAGIDVEYYGRDGLLEYDWIVRPGADAAVIAMRFRGTDEMVLDSAGNLRLQLDGGELVQRAPVAYQIVGGAHRDVTAAYDVRLDGTVRITIGVYDRSVALVIDPVLVYSTYLGGSGEETANSIAVDAAGNTYVTGDTGSSDFFTVNPFDPELNQPDTSPFRLSFDAYVTKFNANGVLVFSSYLGGGGPAGSLRQSVGKSVVVDAAGHVWVGGYTQSPLFPTTVTAPYVFLGQTDDPNGAGGFLTELAADGASLLYSSVFRAPYLSALDAYLPDTTISDIAVDDAGKVYATSNGHVLKLDPATNRADHVTYIGGRAFGIAVDSRGQAYVTGFTNSPSFPTKNALFPVLRTPETFFAPDRSGTGFVTKLSSDGDVLFSTYLGGSSSDVANDVAVDDFGVIHVVGQTASNDLPVPGGLDTSLGGNFDGFLLKLANDGSSVLYGTYIGGSGIDSVTGVGVDSQGRTYLSGTTDSIDLPTVRAHQPTFNFGPFNNFNPNDGFAASIAADGGSFAYLTYWGGSGVDELRGVAVDSAGNASYVGTTTSPDLLTSSAAQPHLLGFDTFIVRLLAGDAGTIALSNAPFMTVEGNPYDGLVAFFSTNGTETAEQFSAIIDWGDGTTSAGTIAGNFADGFQIFGNHLYADKIGTHDFFVTLRNSLGRIVTTTSTGIVAGDAEARAYYRVSIDTAALAGAQGLLSFQFNPGAIPRSPDAEARITGLSLFGGATGGSTIDGDVFQVSSNEFTLRPSGALNRLIENVTLGTRIEFDLVLVGPGLTQPGFGDFADVFALQLFGTDGVTPLLGTDPSASSLRIELTPHGSTQARSSAAAVTVAASGRATVENAAVSLTLTPVSIQEGLEFNGAVATFTNGNPLESAGEFTAQIDWGDGSPVTAGAIFGTRGNFTVSGAHVYQTVGSYTLVVKVVEPDGLEVTSATGRSILAALTFKNNWSPSYVSPVSGDFNGDGILDVAVGPFLAAPTPTFETGVGILLGQGDGSFELAGFQITGQFGWNVTQLVAADFNNDGKLDVAAAVAKFGAPTVVELLLGNGDGTLQPTIRLTELANAGNLTAADFDRDGNLDLIYTDSSSNTLKVALGNGNGTFDAQASTTISGGLVFVADMDGDAVPDIIRASFSFGTASLHFHRGLGNGSFATPLTFASGLSFASLAIHDFDGDGNRDVAVAVSAHLNIYSGNGDGTFDAPLQKTGGRHDYVVAADFNSDDRPDLATIDPVGSRVSVFLNDGVGGFADGVRYEGVYAPAGLLTGDFDRDGHIDLATFGNTAVVSVLPGFGDGTFASAVRYSTGFSGNLFSGSPQVALTADVNGDSHTDAVILFTGGVIVTELGNGDGTFQSASLPALPMSSSSIRAPLLVDVNNDGRLDVVAATGSGISTVLGSGDGAFPIRDVRNPTRTREAAILADFNQDGRLDVAGTFNVGGNRLVAVSLANADGTFQNTVFYTTGGGTRLLVGDFNADSRLDLAVPTLGGISVLLGNANGTFAAALNTVVGTPPFDPHNSPESAKVGDFNGDGKLDIVQVGFFGSGFVLPGNGNGTFGTALTFTNNTFSRDVAVGDFNADGKLDLVTAEESGERFSARVGVGGLSVLLGNGNGTFQAAVDYFADLRPHSVTLGDFNHDGQLDIAAANRGSNNLSILLGNANGTFQNAINYVTTGASPRSIAIGDLNADGNPDLAVVNRSRDTAILLGNADGTFQPALNYYFFAGDEVSSASSQAAIGDLNGDGRADLVVGDNLLFGNGDGTFPNRLFTYLPAVINQDFQSSEPSDVAAGDLNADGTVDLAVSMRGTTVILLGNGNGSFLPPKRLDPPVAGGIGNTSNRVGLADMDGDGDLDLLTLHASVQGGGAVAMWRNDGAGTFSTPLVRNVPFPFYDFNLVTGPDLEIGDLNGDGFADVVVTDTGTNDTDANSSGGVSVLLGIGDGSLALPVRYLVAPRQSAERVTLADLNRDGRPEIITLTSPLGNGARSAVALFTNNGDGSFGPVRIYDHGGFGTAGYLAAGDFNSDGAADIIVPQTGGTSGDFSIIFAGDGPLLVTDAPVTVTGTNVNPRAGTAFTATVATFIDNNPFGEAGDFTATINWGDSQTSTGLVRDNPLGGFEVTGSHTYATSGVFTTTVTVLETGEGTHRGSAMARVSGTDQPLTATGLVFSAMEDLPFTGVVATFTDANPNGSRGDFRAVINWGDGQTSPGVIAVSVGGGFSVIGTHTYTNPGTLPVRVDIVDIGGSSATATSTAQVAPRVNQAPVAIGDAYSTNEDTSLVVLAAQGVLANDSDLDGDTLSAVVVVLPAHGALTFIANGSFTYLPAANYFGSDSFTYRAKDGSADSQVSTVTIIVKPVNDGPRANADSAMTNEDTLVTIRVLDNDTGIDGVIDPTNVVFTSQPIHGAVRADAVTGRITYTPQANFFGSDSLRYKVRDHNGVLSNEAVVSITVNAVNDAPLANNDHYVTREDTPLIIGAALGLLANDTDVDGDSLTASFLTLPAHGTLTLNSNGSFSYVPIAEFFGIDSFRYRASDGMSDSGPVTVSLIILPVNDDPVVSPLADRVINEGSPFTSSGSFSDPDRDDSWTATVDYGDGTGAQPVTLAGANFTLDHNYLDSGLYFVNVKVGDQRGKFGSANFTVTVQNLAATVQAGLDLVSSEGALVSLLGSFADPGRLDTHTATINWGDGTAAQPLQVKEASGAGTVFASHAYADDNVYVVTVTVTDDEGASASDTLTVTVGNVAPRVEAGLDRTINAGELVALPALFTREVFDASFGPFSFQSVAGSFVDPGAVDSHTATIDWGDGTVEAVSLQERTFGSQGSTSRTIGAVDRTHRYSSSGNFSVLVTVTDNDGGIGSDSFMVTVNANQTNNPPTANDDQKTTDEDTAVTIPVLVNDSFAPDVDEILSVTEISQPGHGAAVINPEGTITYTPNANYYGGDSFTYTISDGHGGTATASVTITVTPVNDAPAAGDDSTATAEDTAVTIDVLANDSDTDADTLSVITAGDPPHGMVTVNAGGTFTYTPDANYYGGDSFTYTISDGHGGTATASVAISVTSVNDPPAAVNNVSATAKGIPITIAVLANDSDLDGTLDATAVAIVAAASHGTTSVNPTTGFVTYTPAANYTGPDSFTYKVKDNSGADSNAATVSITVKAPVPDVTPAECEVSTLNIAGTPGTATRKDDADHPGSSVIIVTGTSRHDVILIEPRPGNTSQVRVMINGQLAGTFTNSSFARFVAFGLAGHDTIIVAWNLEQDAKLFGDAGNDSLFGGAGKDGLSGGTGNDHLFGGWDNDTLCGCDGNDFLFGQWNNDFLGGGAGNDQLFGESGDDQLESGAGHDYLFGGIDNDHLSGQAGNDILYGESGNDIVMGGAGNDHLFGGIGRDLLIGGTGDDTLYGEGDDDILAANATIHDNNELALIAILLEWTSSNSYTKRVNNIRLGNGVNGAFKLDNTAVLDDSRPDTLWGHGGLDWFLTGVGDRIRDKAATEQ